MAKKPVSAEEVSYARKTVAASEMAAAQDKEIKELTVSLLRVQSSKIVDNTLSFYTDDTPNVFGCGKGPNIKEMLDAADITYSAVEIGTSTTFAIELSSEENYEKFIGMLLRRYAEKGAASISYDASESIRGNTEKLESELEKFQTLFDIDSPQALSVVFGELRKSADLLHNVRRK